MWRALRFTGPHLCFPQKRLRVRSRVRLGAASRGAWRRAWRWSIRGVAQPWTGRPAESQPTAAWTATALRGSEYQIPLRGKSTCAQVDSLYLCVSLIFSGMRLGADSQFSDFLDGLGPGQLVGRQTLATPAMGEWWRDYFRMSLNVWVLHQVSPAGDVQIGLMDKKGQLEVEVIRARGLTPKPGSKSLPGTTQTLQLSFQHISLPPLHQPSSFSSFLPQLPMSRCTCWITVHVKPKRKPRLHERPWSLSTSSTCSSMRVLRGRCFR